MPKGLKWGPVDMHPLVVSLRGGRSAGERSQSVAFDPHPSSTARVHSHSLERRERREEKIASSYPNSWMWKPWRPSARPEMLPTTVVGPSPDWVKVTVPSTPAVPVRTQMAFFSSATTERTAERPAETRLDARGARATLENGIGGDG